MSRPNVIVIVTDDQGYGDLGCHGNPVACTPSLDQLHHDSVRLTDFHVAPMCTATRGQLLTGMHAIRNGAMNVSSGRSLMRSHLPTMADCFRAGGYATGLFGKWHLGDNYPYRPSDRGFDETLWFPSSHINSVPDYWENDYFDDVYIHNGQQERQSGYCTEVFFKAAKDWIKQRVDAEEPFFTYIAANAPHWPLWVPAEDKKDMEEFFAQGEDVLPKLDPGHRDRIIRFLAMIRNVDTQIGQLRAFLADQGVDRDTLLVFMTDNGSTFGHTYFNAGMKGGKCTLWEGGHRVPCFMHWPNGNLGEARDIGGLTQIQDLLPTFLEWFDLERPEGPPMDGISLADAFAGKREVPEDRALFINYSRMPKNTDYPTPDSGAIVEREGAAVLWKHWRFLEDKELYDLDTDPEQKQDVSAEHPEIVAQMRGQLDAWWESVSSVANKIESITIGSEHENPSKLCSCEWQDVFVDMQHQVRAGECCNSYWNLDVAKSGTYQFELRRWPRESGLRLSEACAATEVTDGVLPAGHAFPIARARLMIDRKVHQQKLTDDDVAAVFTLPLEAGPALLHTWFDDARGQPLVGSYYVYVERLSE